MMEYFAGLDVSLRSCALCIVDGKGEVLLERELPCEIDEIAECLAVFPHPIERVGFEAGTMSQHLYFGLKGEGLDVVCMEARQVNAALSAMRNKTDKNDARGIAQILRTGWFSPVHMKSREAHGVRALLSTRKALLNKTIDLANEVRGLLKIFGIRLPKTVKHVSFDGIVRPMIEIDDVLEHALVPLLDARLVLYQHFLELDRRVKRAASQDEVCMRMMTVPGVGPIAALTFKSAVDDPSRFRRSRTVAAHFGLTPRRYQSGEQDNPGRISKAGDRDVRAAVPSRHHPDCEEKRDPDERQWPKRKKENELDPNTQLEKPPCPFKERTPEGQSPSAACSTQMAALRPAPDAVLVASSQPRLAVDVPRHRRYVLVEKPAEELWPDERRDTQLISHRS